MTKPDATPRKAAARRKRVSRLNSAILRIGGSLDIDTVLREAVEGARDLTGARFAAVATADENGNALDYVTSGLTEEQRGALAGWSAGTRFFEHLRGREGPLRLADFPAYAKSLGFPADPIPCKNFQGMPMRHRGAHVGNFFLGGKKDKGAFTDADEEMLVLFASQAAATVSNALTHRDERRARADLEALVETSPVGVVVFSVADGRVLMVNRESRRIVASLHIPGLELPELAATLTCRRGDGREITLADIANAETLRAEEVELSLPDGRNVRMLISATPTRSPAGEVLSMIVTMQDLAPLEALERSRAEFLGMVSHELRAPLAAIKGSAAMVADATRTYDPAELLQFFRIVDTEANRMDSLIGDLLDVGRIDTGTLTVDPAPVELGPLVDRARSTFVSSRGRQTLHIDLPPDLPRVAADQRRIAQVLDNLISNASRHSPDSAPIRIAASRKDGFVEVSVTDGGKGLPQNELSRLFRKRAGVRGDRAGGTGLGLAICKGLVEAHGGRIRADSGGAGLRHAVLVHAAGGGPGQRSRGRARREQSHAVRGRAAAGVHPGGGRRPADHALRARRAVGGGLRSGGHRRPGGSAAPHPGACPRSRADGPDAARHRRHRIDAGPSGAGEPAGHLHLRIRTGRDRRQGA